jgi:hypothetical protein
MQDRRSLPPYEDELSLALLRSAQHDEPSAAAYSKVAAALGVSAAVGFGASLPAQAALASNGLPLPALARWSSSLFAKVVLVGVSSVLLVAGGVALLHHRSPVGASAPLVRRMAANALKMPGAANIAPSSLAQVAVLANAGSAPTPPLPTPPLPIPPLPLPPLPIPPLSVAKPGAGSSAAAVPAAAAVSRVALAQNAQSASVARAPKASSLPEQVLSLDRARVALNSGDAGAALAEIAHYRGAWPRGVFLTEASVLEIEALAKRGEIVLAGMRAQAFVTAHPDCPQADRLRALIPSQAR